MLTRASYGALRVRAAQLGWSLTREWRPVLGWVYLLASPDGQVRILYDLNGIDRYLPHA